MRNCVKSSRKFALLVTIGYRIVSMNLDSSSVKVLLLDIMGLPDTFLIIDEQAYYR